jgi:predicted PurR-regulated permease PerM
VLGLIGALMAIPVAAGLKVVLAEQLRARDSADADAEAGLPSAGPGERDTGDPGS